jgi:hypothetical protein
MPEINFAEYEDYENEFVEKGGGGGGKRVRSSDSKTSNAAREESRGNARESRAESAGRRILSDIERLLKTRGPERERSLGNYVAWVNLSLESGLRENGHFIENPLVGPEDLRYENTLPQLHAGGQKAQKTSSAVTVTHIPTMISAESQETRSQEQNRNKATEVLTLRLQEHLSNWRAVLTNGDPSKPPKELTAEFFEN